MLNSNSTLRPFAVSPHLTSHAGHAHQPWIATTANSTTKRSRCEWRHGLSESVHRQYTMHACFRLVHTHRARIKSPLKHACPDTRTHAHTHTHIHKWQPSNVRVLIRVRPPLLHERTHSTEALRTDAERHAITYAKPPTMRLTLLFAQIFCFCGKNPIFRVFLTRSMDSTDAERHAITCADMPSAVSDSFLGSDCVHVFDAFD